MERPFPGEFGTQVDEVRPVDYRATNMFRAKAYRRATRIMQLNAQIVTLKELVEAEKREAKKWMDAANKLRESIAGLGYKVTFKDGEVKLEVA